MLSVAGRHSLVLKIRFAETVNTIATQQSSKYVKSHVTERTSNKCSRPRGDHQRLSSHLVQLSVRLMCYALHAAENTLIVIVAWT